MWIDTHCHLDAAEFAADRDAVAVAARAAGVDTIVVPAVAAGNFAAVRACAERYAHCRVAYGIHPMCTDRARDEDLDTLRAWLARERHGPHPPVAIGEIGLDGFVPGLDMARQEFFFRAQLEIAREFDLPVLLHIRRAQDVVLKHLRRARVRGGIAHAFNGSRQQADMFIDLGYVLGFGGAMTFPRATRIRELAASLPLTALVLETDAPDIPPLWLAGGRNAPAEIPAIGQVLGELRDLPAAEVARSTAGSARAILGLSAGPAGRCR